MSNPYVVVAGVALALMVLAALLLLALRAASTPSKSTSGHLFRLSLLCFVAGLGAITMIVLVLAFGASKVFAL